MGVKCCHPFIPGERSLTAVLLSLIHLCVLFCTRKPARLEEVQCASMPVATTTSGSQQKERKEKLLYTTGLHHLDKCNKSSVIKKYLPLKPKCCILTLLLPKWATISTSASSRHIFRVFYIWQSQEVYKWTYHPRLWPEPAMEEPTLSKTWCCVNSSGTEMQ